MLFPFQRPKDIFSDFAVVFKVRDCKQTQVTNQTRQQDRTPQHHTEAQHHGAQHRQAGQQGRAEPHSTPQHTKAQLAMRHTGTPTPKAIAQHDRKQNDTAQRGGSTAQHAPDSAAQHCTTEHQRQQQNTQQHTTAPGARNSTYQGNRGTQSVHQGFFVWMPRPPLFG